MPDTLGHYQLLDRLGAGGLGEVYRGRDTRAGRTVVIKLVPLAVAQDGVRRVALARAAAAAAAISHPHVAALYELGEEGGQLFLAGEYVPGEPLSRLTAGRAINPRRAVEIAAQVADGIAEVHAAGIVHGDLRPDNVIVTPKGRAKVLDTGLTGFTAGGALRDAAPGVLAGGRTISESTLLYTSPEQVLGEGVDYRTDIFSLGAILYEMLTGEAPFHDPSVQGVLLKVMQATPPPPSTVNPACPRPLDGIVKRSLAKSLDHRYQSMAELASDLRAAADALDAHGVGGDAGVEPEDASPAAGALLSRTWVLAIVAVVVLLAAAWYLGVAGR